MSQERVLHQFSFSHYAMKARLALARKGLPVKVKNYLPMTQLEVLRLSGQRQVPLLEDNGQTIHDSTEILVYLEATYPDPPLAPKNKRRAAEVWLIEDWADEVLGLQVRAVGLNMIKERPSLAASADKPTGISWLDPLAPVLAPVMARAMLALYNIGDDLPTARKKILPSLNRVQDMVSAGLLKSDTPTVAEDAVAALLSPLLPLGGYLEELEGHPALLWAGDYLQNAPALQEL